MTREDKHLTRKTVYKFCKMRGHGDTVYVFADDVEIPPVYEQFGMTTGRTSADAYRNWRRRNKMTPAKSVEKSLILPGRWKLYIEESEGN